MIIQCDQCKTRFRLDDSRITGAGVRVRCSRCRHTFVVTRETEEEREAGTAAAPQAANGEAGSQQERNIDCSDQREKECEGATEHISTDERTSGTDTDASGPGSDTCEGAETGETAGKTPVEGHRYETESDESWVNFPDGAGSGEEAGSGPDGDFSFETDIRDGKEDEFFRTAGGASPAAGRDTADAQSGTTPDFGGGAEENETHPGPAVWEEEGSVPTADGNAGDMSEEFPPLGITSRRKRSFSRTGVLAGVVLVVLAAGSAIFYLSDRGVIPFRLPAWFSPSNGSAIRQGAEGEVAISSLEGSFVRNDHDGEILVVRGEVRNQSTSPLSSFQVQGYVYGSKGEVLLTSSAHLGKDLPAELLKAMSVHEIEASLEKQTGNSSSDTVVRPGQGVPFLIFFRNVPEGAGEFGAEAHAALVAAP